MEQERILYMTFTNALGNRMTISVENAKPDLEAEEVKDFMKLILEKNIFQPRGYELQAIHSAKVVDSETNSFDLVL